VSDPPHPLPGVAAGSLIADVVEVCDHYRHTGVRYHVAVVVEPAFGSRPVTLISNAPATAQRALLTALLARQEEGAPCP
jgi:hypothetical protein